MPKISRIYAHEILDSRATPTVEAVVILDGGSYGVSSVPSGSSTGSYEASELRDGDANRYLGKGVLKAVSNINNDISKSLSGSDVSSITEFDQKLLALDGTANKTKLGANAILGVSMAMTKALAMSEHLSLYRYIAKIAGNTNKLYIPDPVFNMINGGKHGAGNLDFQEFHVIPGNMGSFSAQLQVGAEIYQTIKKLLARRGAIHSVGDEGGFAPNLFTNLDALEILNESILEVHHKPGVDVDLGLDVASNSFWADGKFTIKDRSNPMDTGEFIEYLRDLNSQYHLRLLEDPLNEDDWRGWSSITQELGAVTTIVGDDLLVTNKERVKKAITEKACTAVLIKPNQIGTVSETIDVVKLARTANWKVNVSHRSGETTDTFIADFAVGVGSDYAKFGAPARGERVCKYNRFLSIETELAQS